MSMKTAIETAFEELRRSIWDAGTDEGRRQTEAALAAVDKVASCIEDALQEAWENGFDAGAENAEMEG